VTIFAERNDRSAKVFFRARNPFLYGKFEKSTVENELNIAAVFFLHPKPLRIAEARTESGDKIETGLP